VTTGTLAGLPIGGAATVVGYRVGGRRRRRWLDMGIVPGTVVVAVRAAPMGDPVEYRVRGTRLAIRREAAADVLVVEARR